MLAAGLALACVVAAVRGVDLPAALYRVELFRTSGLTLWDNQWYGGHWTLNYSALFPPLAGVFGLGTVRVLSAAGAAWAFDRLVVEHFGPRARLGSLVFAAWTLAQVAQAQLPYLLGEAFALSAFLMLRRRHWLPALALGLASSLASPLAGAFLVLGAVAVVLVERPAWRLAAGVSAAAVLPVAVSAVLFPGQGAEAFPFLDFLSIFAAMAACALWLGRRDRGLRIGLLLYLAAILVTFAVPDPIGGNISRLGECLGAPLIVCLMASGRVPVPLSRWALAGGALFAVLVPLQWGPALPSLYGSGAPSRSLAYFQPLISYLRAHDRTQARVEVVPTQWHWEAAYVAPVVPLARGWERQLDTADNPLFYDGAPLTPAAYRSWLVTNGVSYVALPDAPLDYAAVAEARVIRAGVPGLRQIWGDAHWRVFAVSGVPGLVSGPARLAALDSSSIRLTASAPGDVVVRVRYSPGWSVTSGNACVTPGPGDWISVRTQSAGPVALAVNPLRPGTPC